MRRFESMVQVQRFVLTHAAVINLFNLGRHLVMLNNIGTSGQVRSVNGVGR